MTDRDEKQFIILMSTLYELYEKEGSPTKTEIYFNVLQEYPIEKVKEGVTKILKNRVYTSFPKPADIIEAIEGKKEDIETIAFEQYTAARNTNVSMNQNVKFDDILIHATIATMGGWPTFRTIETKMLHWQETEFVKAYCIFYRQGKNGYLEDQSVGLIGAQGNSPSNTTRSGMPVYQIVSTKHPRETLKQIDEPKKDINVMKELGKRIKEKGDV